MVHQRSEESWMRRELRDFFLRRSLKDKLLNETVFRKEDWKIMEKELNEKFPQESHKKPSFGQILCDGRGQGGFQQ